MKKLLALLIVAGFVVGSIGCTGTPTTGGKAPPPKETGTKVPPMDTGAKPMKDTGTKLPPMDTHVTPPKDTHVTPPKDTGAKPKETPKTDK